MKTNEFFIIKCLVGFEANLKVTITLKLLKLPEIETE
jgi:hypothetical protein